MHVEKVNHPGRSFPELKAGLVEGRTPIADSAILDAALESGDPGVLLDWLRTRP